jgi:hypothetical protein
MKINEEIDNENKLYEYVMYIFDRYYHDNMPIRLIGIALGKLTDNNEYQINIFEDFDKVIKDKKMDNAIDEIKSKYGNNSILRGTSLLADSTIKERNGKIGGHKA